LRVPRGQIGSPAFEKGSQCRFKESGKVLTFATNGAKTSAMANDETTVGRRVTLQILGVGGISAALVGCGGGGGGGDDHGGGGAAEEPTAAAGPSCDSEIDAQSRTLRQTLNYVENSEVEGSNCANCVQYQEGAYGDCGGCAVFTGPVAANGHCSSWAAAQAEEPAEEAPAEAEEPAPEGEAAEGEAAEG
jgi:hypothetical protein